MVDGDDILSTHTSCCYHYCYGYDVHSGLFISTYLPQWPEPLRSGDRSNHREASSSPGRRKRKREGSPDSPKFKRKHNRYPFFPPLSALSLRWIILGLLVHLIRHSRDVMNLETRHLKVELRRDLTTDQVEKDFSEYGKVDNVTIIEEHRGMRIACVDFKNPRIALTAKRDLQEKGDYGTITFWEVRRTLWPSSCLLGVSNAAVKGEASRHIWVGNLDPSISTKEVHEEFSYYGEVESVSRFRFHAFVDFRKVSYAIKAYNELQVGWWIGSSSVGKHSAHMRLVPHAGSAVGQPVSGS